MYLGQPPRAPHGPLFRGLNRIESASSPIRRFGRHNRAPLENVDRDEASAYHGARVMLESVRPGDHKKCRPAGVSQPSPNPVLQG